MSKNNVRPALRRKRNALSMTAALTVVVLLLFIGVNWLATALEHRYALSADLSFNSLTLQSAATKETLSSLKQPIELYLLTAVTADTFGDSPLLRSDLRTLLERYQSLNPLISFREESLLRSPNWSTRFSEQLNGEEVTTDCVIVYCPGTDHARMLTSDDFLRLQYDLDSQSYAVSGYAVEKALTEGIIYVSDAETPTVQILTGHGELGAGETAALESHLHDAGYQTVRVSLHDQSSLDVEQPLLILCPRFDLTEQELAWLREYLAADGGILYITGYTSPVDLQRFNALLGEFGLGFRPGVVVATGTDQTSYYGDSPVSLLPYMQAAPETQELLASRQDILLMPGARAVTISEDRDISIYAGSLLKSGEAYIRAYEDGLETLERQEGDETGYFDLAALARRYDEDKTSGTMIAVGCSAMFTEEWIYENTYTDAFLRALMKALGTRQPVSLDISVKSAARAGLGLKPLDWAVWAAVLLPLLILAAALIVLLPRRHL